MPCYEFPIKDIRKHNSINSSLTPEKEAEALFSWIAQTNKTRLGRIHRENPLIPPQARVDIHYYCYYYVLVVLCVSYVNPRVYIHCDSVSCLLFAPPLIIPCLTTHKLSLFDMGYLAEVRVEVWTCIILGSKGFP